MKKVLFHHRNNGVLLRITSLYVVFLIILMGCGDSLTKTTITAGQGFYSLTINCQVVTFLVFFSYTVSEHMIDQRNIQPIMVDSAPVR